MAATMQTTTRFHRSLVAVLAVVLSAFVTSCGGGGGDDDLLVTLSRAAETTGSAETVRMAMTITFEDVPGVPDEPSVTDALTAVDGSAGRGTTTMQGQDIEFLWVDQAYYYEVPGLPDGAKWMRLSFDDLEDLTGIDIASLSNESPTDALARLTAAGDVEEVGDEEVGGFSTTHYSVTVDLERMNESLDGYMSDEALEMTKGMFGDTYPMDVWIDGDGFVRKMRWVADLSHATDPPPGMPSEGRIVFEMTMSDFGEPLGVTAPPEDEVVDFSDLN
jgi:hypothetical protein